MDYRKKTKSYRHPRVHPNQLRWLQPPSHELIRAVLAKHSITQRHFERFFGIALRTIHRALLAEDNHDYRAIPPAYWHYFYEDDPQQKSSAPVAPIQPKPEQPTPKRIIQDPSLDALM